MLPCGCAVVFLCCRVLTSHLTSIHTTQPTPPPAHTNTGLEQQTIESINLLKMRKTPFIIALNKVARLYGWKANNDLAIREAFKRQKEHVGREFDDRSSQVFLQLNEQGLNVALYWKNPDPRK